MPPTDYLDIITINYRRPADTVACVQSLQKMLCPEQWQYRIIIVDNASNDDSIATITAALPDCRTLAAAELDSFDGEDKLLLIESTDNLGFAGGNNLALHLGMRQKTTHFWLLNNDTVVPVDALSKLTAAFVPPMLLGARLCCYDRPELTQACGGGKINYFTGINRNYQVDGKVLDYISGASCFFDRQAIDELGYWDEKYFLNYEDLDYSQTALKHGYRLQCASEVKILHRETVSIGRRSFTDVYYRTRNCFYFYRKHCRILLPWIYFLHLSKLVKGLLVKDRLVYWHAVCRAYWDYWKM